jgi:hypothetical protein
MFVLAAYDASQRAALREDIRQKLYIDLEGRDPLATGDATGLDYWTDETIRDGWDWAALQAHFEISAKTVLQNSTDAARAFLAPALFKPTSATPAYTSVQQLPQASAPASVVTAASNAVSAAAAQTGLPKTALLGIAAALGWFVLKRA